MYKTQNSFKPLLLACLGSILIGSSAIFVRFSELGPVTTAFYRMLFALPLLALWVRWERKKRLYSKLLPAEGRAGLMFAGLFFALDLALWNWAIDHTTIVNSTLFNNTAVFFVPLILWVFFNERPSLRFMIAISIGSVGCFCLLGESFSLSFKNLLGDAVALGSGIMVALYLISLQRVRGGISTGLLMFWTGLSSLLFLAILALVTGESFWPFSYKDAISFLGQAVLVHVMGQSLLAYSLGQIPATYAALIMFLAPVTGAVLGWIIYAEALSSFEILGMVLVMVSIVSVRKNF
ncbi:MAG: DMT family transporter [Alphaproteobacteria bacterium]|nr:DMT family transporter [Alphaproteobacteria bacterium]